MHKTIKTRSGRTVVLPTPTEDAAITEAAVSDPDAVPYTDAEWEKVRPQLRRGRPPVEQRKPTLNMRVDPDVLVHLRSLGKGWQTKVNTLLRELMEEGRI